MPGPQISLIKKRYHQATRAVKYAKRATREAGILVDRITKMSELPGSVSSQIPGVHAALIALLNQAQFWKDSL